MGASSNPTPAYRRDPAEAAFRRAIELAHLSSIHDFLFPSQVAYTEYLLQMLRQPRRISAIMSIKTVVPSDAPSLNESKYCVLFPSFSIGSLSVMYHISEHMKSNLSPYKKPYISRCVRDDQHGLFFKFADLDTGLTEIDVLIQLSPGVREHVLLVLATEPFRVAMETMARGGVYDEEHMYEALIYSMRVRQTRQCPSCGRDPIACACSLNLVQKRAPIDFDRDLLNLTIFNGGYDGVCYQAIHEGGVNLGNWVSSVGVSAEFSFDDHERRKLESWAMWDSLQGQENILKTVLANADTSTLASEYYGERDCGFGASFGGFAKHRDRLPPGSFSHDIDVLSGAEMGQSMARNVPMDEFSELRTNEFNTDELPELQTANRMGSVPQSDRVHNYSSTASALPAYDGSTAFRASAVLSSGNEVATEAYLSTHPAGVTEQPRVSELPPAAIAETVLPVQQVQPTQINREASTPLGRHGTTHPRRIGRPPAPQARRVTRLVPIMPGKMATTSAVAKSAMKTEFDDATRKVELQKARNRESAVRSNEKRKKQVQALENYLTEAKKQESVLREHEQELRETNLALRAKLENF